MRRALSALVLTASVVASVATSELPPETTTTASLHAPAAGVTAAVPASFTLDVLATQSPAGPFGGAVIVQANVAAPGAATVTATLSVLDGAGNTEIARDTAVVASGTGALFVFDDLDAFRGCADGATCDQAFQLVLYTTGDATIDWTFDAELYDLDDSGRTGDLSVHLR